MSDLVLGQSASVVGRVKERDGKALEGVVIRASTTDGKQAGETTSDARGEFELLGLSAGDYVFTFERKGFQTFTTRGLPVEAGEKVKLRRVIEMAPERPPYAVVRGAVFTAEGFSLPNANITIEKVGEGKRLKRETVSVDGGEFGFRLPPEKAIYKVTATARGFVTGSKEIEVSADEVRQIALTLERVK